MYGKISRRKYFNKLALYLLKIPTLGKYIKEQEING
jgi:hypothetical protein